MVLSVDQGIIALLKERGLDLDHAHGDEYTVCCPFHQESRPSFNLNVRRGVWHCFGCDAKGDLVTLICRLDDCSREEARLVLGLQSGLDDLQFRDLFVESVVLHTENSLDLLVSLRGTRDDWQSFDEDLSSESLVIALPV